MAEADSRAPAPRKRHAVLSPRDRAVIRTSTSGSPSSMPEAPNPSGTISHSPRRKSSVSRACPLGRLLSVNSSLLVCAFQRTRMIVSPRLPPSGRKTLDKGRGARDKQDPCDRSDAPSQGHGGCRRFGQRTGRSGGMRIRIAVGFARFDARIGGGFLPLDPCEHGCQTARSRHLERLGAPIASFGGAEERLKESPAFGWGIDTRIAPVRGAFPRPKHSRLAMSTKACLSSPEAQCIHAEPSAPRPSSAGNSITPCLRRFATRC